MLASSALVLLAALAAPAQAPVVPAADKVQVVPLSRDGELLVTFKLAQSLTDEVRAAIHSGLTIRFIYTVELRRSTSVWFDRTIRTANVTTSVKYDTLTRRYQVSRMIDGRTEWADTTDNEDTAWNALTGDFTRLSLFHGAPLEPNAEYYVRVSVKTAPRNASFVWPWVGADAVGFAKFTFVR